MTVLTRRKFGTPYRAARRKGSAPLASLALLAVLAVLGGCEGLNGQAGYARFYDPALVAAAAREGRLALVVQGSPVAGMQDAAIAAVMPAPTLLPGTRYRATSPTAQDAPYRVILIFQPAARALGGDDVCARPAEQPSTAPGGPVRVQATFCVGDRAASTAWADGPAVTGIDDPSFRHWLGLVIDRLLPTVNPATARSGGGA